MKYLNGKDIFPAELLELLQDYAQGQYIYIPKRDNNKQSWGASTNYRKELARRNSQIYTKHLIGLTDEELVKTFHLSGKSVARILLNKRREALIMKEKIIEVLEQWGIKTEIKQIYDTVWSVGEDNVIKTYKELSLIKRNIEMMKTLQDCGIPVAKLIPSAEGKDYVEMDSIYYLMMSKLPGRHITDIYREDHQRLAQATGAAIAKLHKAFLICEPKISCWDSNLFDEMSGWVKDTLQTKDYRFCSEADYQKSLEELKLCYDRLPRQLIHRDLYYGNLLFDQGQFSGYIDFDLSQKNVRVFDLAYFLMGLLVDHSKDANDVSKWYEIVAGLIKGYEEISPLTVMEKDSLCCLMKNIELLFTAFFMTREEDELAEQAAELYYFVDKNENKLRQVLEHIRS